jgi:hypothetical protein
MRSNAKSIDVKFRKIWRCAGRSVRQRSQKYLLEQANVRSLAVTAIIVQNAAARGPGSVSSAITTAKCMPLLRRGADGQGQFSTVVRHARD